MNIDNGELNEYNDEDSVVILKDEDGNDVKFEFLDLIEYEGENYILLLPAEEVEDENADEVVILKEDSSSQEDEEAYVSVEDEDTLNKIFEIFKDKFKEEFNFIDD
ncbi:MAG: DUF1292 domain-containing protein [Clostridia bacterium]|nr:DUF1292 domain-containing protein [Clostridia bacterium]